jgi:hypothetical protein
MPNTSVRAAAEGMPNLNRRTALAMTSAGIISAITVLSTSQARAMAVELPIIDRRALGAVSPRLQELEMAFNANWARVRALEPQLSATERKLNAARPPRPVDEEWSADLHARFKEMPVGQLNDSTHPVVIETREVAARNTARREAYKAACEPFDAKLEQSESGYRRLLDNADRIGRRALRVPAESLADVMVKIRIHKVNIFDASEILAVVLKDVARLDRASRKVVQS